MSRRLGCLLILFVIIMLLIIYPNIIAIQTEYNIYTRWYDAQNGDYLQRASWESHGITKGRPSPLHITYFLDQLAYLELQKPWKVKIEKKDFLEYNEFEKHITTALTLAGKKLTEKYTPEGIAKSIILGKIPGGGLLGTIEDIGTLYLVQDELNKAIESLKIEYMGISSHPYYTDSYSSDTITLAQQIVILKALNYYQFFDKNKIPGLNYPYHDRHNIITYFKNFSKETKGSACGEKIQAKKMKRTSKNRVMFLDADVPFIPVQINEHSLTPCYPAGDCSPAGCSRRCLYNIFPASCEQQPNWVYLYIYNEKNKTLDRYTPFWTMWFRITPPPGNVLKIEWRWDYPDELELNKIKERLQKPLFKKIEGRKFDELMKMVEYVKAKEPELTKYHSKLKEYYLRLYAPWMSSNAIEGEKIKNMDREYNYLVWLTNKIKMIEGGKIDEESRIYVDDARVIDFYEQLFNEYPNFEKFKEHYDKHYNILKGGILELEKKYSNKFIVALIKAYSFWERVVST